MSTEKKVIVSMSLDPELLNEIDNKRGLIPRSAFIENELKQSIKFAQKKDDILKICTELENITQIRGRYPTKHPLMSPAAQMMVHDIQERVDKIKSTLIT